MHEYRGSAQYNSIASNAWKKPRLDAANLPPQLYSTDWRPKHGALQAITGALTTQPNRAERSPDASIVNNDYPTTSSSPPTQFSEIARCFYGRSVVNL